METNWRNINIKKGAYRWAPFSIYEKVVHRTKKAFSQIFIFAVDTYIEGILFENDTIHQIQLFYKVSYDTLNEVI